MRARCGMTDHWVGRGGSWGTRGMRQDSPLARKGTEIILYANVLPCRPPYCPVYCK